MADTRVVTSVRVVAHTAGVMGPNSRMSHNHWSIFVLLIDGFSSVRINMGAKPGFITGNLEITQHGYVLSNSAIRYWDFPTVEGVTVQHLINLIYQNGRHSYDMSGGGSGCRYWV
jgi:hypothetical protein